MKSIFDKDFFTWENLKTTWEAKLIVFIVRSFLALAVFLLILSCTYKAWQWGEMQWVRKDPLSELEPLINRSIKQKTPEDVTKWLRYRSTEDSAFILDIVPRYAGQIDSIAFFNLSVRSAYLGNKEDAAFWFFYARYRLRYDLLRCGSPEPVRIMNAMQVLAGVDSGYENIINDPQKMSAILQRVLDYDANFPAVNHPDHTCAAVNKVQQGNYAVVHESQWAAIRHMLRITTERAIADMRAANDNGAK